MSMWPALLGLDPGDTRLLVGVEDDPDDENSVRIYLNARYTGLHTHAPVDDDLRRMRDLGWTQHLFIDVPDEALCDCHPELTPALATVAR